MPYSVARIFLSEIADFSPIYRQIPQWAERSKKVQIKLKKGAIEKTREIKIL